jgi:hypothetical protein
LDNDYHQISCPLGRLDHKGDVVASHKHLAPHFFTQPAGVDDISRHNLRWVCLKNNVGWIMLVAHLIGGFFKYHPVSWCF